MSEICYRVPLIIRGRVIDDCTEEFGGRKGGLRFVTPDVGRYFHDLVNLPAESMSRYQQTPIREIADFLDALSYRLNLDDNPYLREAFEVSCQTSGISRSILEALYRNTARHQFCREHVLEYAEDRIGIAYLEGWVPRLMGDGTNSAIRAFGARAVHVIAGNTPAVAFNTVLRSAVTRSDCITKTPSNDPLTFVAILRTMIELDPTHPVTRHFSGSYWKGGNEQFESRLYRPEHVEKIVAWGGFDSIKHITKSLQPGLDLITLDPKHSASVIGYEALASEDSLRDVAQRAACDIGAYNQELCANARMIYVECDAEDPEQLEKLNRLGEYIYQALQTLPAHLSTPAKYLSPGLKEELDGLFMLEDWYRVYRENDFCGAVIVSQSDEPVSFAASLACRTANLVPIKSLDLIMQRINSSTQTIGVYPVTTKTAIRDGLALRGAQMIVTLGYVARMNSIGPMDGIEPERRMLKWVVDQTQDESIPGPWVDTSGSSQN